MLNIVLLASIFLKNMLISDKFFVILYVDIEIEFHFVETIKIRPNHFRNLS